MKPTEFSVLGPLMGGFGSQAFLGCLHADDGIRPAVMVFLPDEIVDSADLFRRVWQETELGSQIDHVNVIGVMGIARLDEGYARVVEYADAESLRSVYRRATTLKKPIPPTVACALVADACMGVHYAHELGMMETGEPLIHGGIRPETLQISFKGMGKVTGYGATTIAEVARKARGTDNVKDAYTAPEQSYGGRTAATQQTDVYALGCVLYEALTGKAPFAADNDLAEAMIRDELSRPQYEGVTDSMAMVVLKATRKKANERYASALEMRHDILEKCEHATETEIRHFMDELFPPETVPRATRDQMLIQAREKPPAPTGKLLTEIPPELVRATKGRFTQPSDADIEAAIGKRIEVTPPFQRAPPPPDSGPPVPTLAHVDDVTEQNVHTMQTRPPTDALAEAEAAAMLDTAPTAQVPALTQRNETTAVVHRDNVKRKRGQSGPVPAATRPHDEDRGGPTQPAPPSWQASPTQPPQYSSSPPVVYRTPPGVLLGLGAAGMLVTGLVVYVVTKEDQPPPPPPPPQVIVQQVPVPAPPATTEAPPSTSTGKPLRDLDAEPGGGKTKSTKPVATGPGKINVTTDPSSMVISINGKQVGTGTASFEGKAGSYKVVAKDKALGAVSSRTVKLRAGQTVDVELVAAKGGLTFDQLPAGCTVFVDGKKIGTTPMPAIQLYAGPHRITIKKDGREVTVNGDVVAGAEIYVTAQFGS